MALIFSPVTQDVIEGPYVPRPGCAFLMLHGGTTRSRLDRELESHVVDALAHHEITALRATDVSGTGDYLDKILGLIRGCGMGVAIFSEATPAPTLANIFFEVGMCLTFGRPVVLAKTEEAHTPSDFVRTEWVAMRDDGDAFRESLSASFESVLGLAGYYRQMAEVAMDADEIDYELAFERYAQAVLIGRSSDDIARIRTIYESLRGSRGSDSRMNMSRRRLMRAVGHFLKGVDVALGRG